VPEDVFRLTKQTHLEQINGGPSVQRWLLVNGSDDSALLRFSRVESGSEVELETLGDLVLEFDLGSEEVGGGPGLHVYTTRVRGGPGGGKEETVIR
jgi:hypothetical protein